jgi:hypothetical protein
LKRIPFGQSFYPTFYLNRKGIRRGKEQEGALDAFEQESPLTKKTLIWEMKKLGLRKSPLMPFLNRSNPINKYIGMLLYTLKKSPW